MILPVICCILLWVLVYLGFQLLDQLSERRWSAWLEARSVQVNKSCIIWSLKCPVRQVKKWCTTRRNSLRLFFQIGSALGVFACCILTLGLLISGVFMYLVLVACVVTRSFFWRVDPMELAHKFPLVSSFRDVLGKVANSVLYQLHSWLKLDSGTWSVSWLFFVLGLLVTLPFHELGHALIAFAEGVGVEKVGIFLFFFVPGMFVTLEEDLLDLSTKSRLRIFCAGFWFNFVLCLLSLGILFLLPLLVSPIFKQQVAVSGVVSREHENSKLWSLFSVGDELVRINNKEIRKVEDIKESIRSLALETSVGICWNKDNFTNSEWFRPFHVCCPGMSNDSWQNEEFGWNCFVQSSFWNTDYPNAVCVSDQWLETQDFALGFCKDENSYDQYLVPYTGTGGRLISLKRWSPRERVYKETLLVATPDSLFNLIWTEYVPRVTRPLWLYELFITLNPIGKIEQFFRFLVVLSAVIGMSNVAPIWMMDGEDIFSWLLVHFSTSVNHIEYIRRKKRLLGWFTALSILNCPLLFIFADL